MAQGQPQEKVSENPFSTKELGITVSTCHPSYSGGIGRKMQSKTRLKKKYNILPDYLKHKALVVWLICQSTYLASMIPEFKS
jgi:hypothetical protein